jgi:hypothetical protein
MECPPLLSFRSSRRVKTGREGRASGLTDTKPKSPHIEKNGLKGERVGLEVGVGNGDEFGRFGFR